MALWMHWGFDMSTKSIVTAIKLPKATKPGTNGFLIISVTDMSYKT